MQKYPRVVIIGGGYGGVRAARDLIKTKHIEVIIIDKNSYHSLPAHYYELGSMFRAEEKQNDDIRLRREFHEYLYTAAIPFTDIFPISSLLDIIQATVTAVHPTERTVVLSNGRVISYDWLLIAIGSMTNYFNIPHLENNALGFKSIEEVLNIRNEIDELFFLTPKHKIISVVVGGAGATGCELAAELVGYMRKLSHVHGRPIGAWRCILVEASSTVLGGMSLWMQKKARARLAKLGVTLLVDSAIVDVWPKLLYIGKDRRAMPFDLLIWTAGVKGACRESIIEGITLHNNCVSVGSHCEVTPYDNIFAVGDVAVVRDARTQKPVAMTAQKAIQEGAYVARSIIKKMKDSSSSPDLYIPRSSSYIVPLGGKYALAQTPYMRLSGIGGWMLKYIVLFRYLWSIIPLSQAVAFLVRDLRMFSRND